MVIPSLLQRFDGPVHIDCGHAAQVSGSKRCPTVDVSHRCHCVRHCHQYPATAPEHDLLSGHSEEVAADCKAVYLYYNEP